jgi:hypothetical protein
MILQDHCTILQTSRTDAQEYGIILKDRWTILQTLSMEMQE